MAKIINKIINIIYTTSIIALYVVFIALDFKNGYVGNTSITIKFIIMILVSLFSAYLFIQCTFIHQTLSISLFSFLAIILTFISDYFLLVLNNHYEVGISIFIGAQIASGIRVHLINKDKILVFLSFGIRIISLIGVIIASFIMKDMNDIYLYLLAIYYFINLVTNFLISVLSYIKEKKKSLLFLTIGFFLFICCDIFVAIANIDQDLYWYAFTISWIFYTPCQYLLSISLQEVIKEIN